jgi:hypothetical protein
MEQQGDKNRCCLDPAFSGQASVRGRETWEPISREQEEGLEDLVHRPAQGILLRVRGAHVTLPWVISPVARRRFPAAGNSEESLMSLPFEAVLFPVRQHRAESRATAVWTVCLVDGWTTTGWRMGPINRHHGGQSAGFMDGHARWLPPRELRCVSTDAQGFCWFQYAAADR